MTATTSAPLDTLPVPSPSDTGHDVSTPNTTGDDVVTPSSKELHRQFLEQAAIANWSSYRLMVLIRKMEACQGYVDYCCKTLTDYLILMCGIGRIAARQRIRVAEALANLPAIEAEFRAGRLSYAKVRALVRIADEKTDRDWAKKVRELTADELEVIAARCRKGTRPADSIPWSAIVDLDGAYDDTPYEERLSTFGRRLGWTAREMLAKYRAAGTIPRNRAASDGPLERFPGNR